MAERVALLVVLAAVGAGSLLLVLHGVVDLLASRRRGRICREHTARLKGRETA